MSDDLPPLDRAGLRMLAEVGWTFDPRSAMFVSDEVGRTPRTEIQARYLLWAWEHGTPHPDDTAT